jgi:hypothetical protein
MWFPGIAALQPMNPGSADGEERASSDRCVDGRFGLKQRIGLDLG